MTTGEQKEGESIVSEERVLIDSLERNGFLKQDTVMIFGVKAPKRDGVIR